jgi:hypothetical protein
MCIRDRQEVRKDSLQVLFDEREISPSVWLPASSIGAVLRKGKNSIRVEFVPADGTAPYTARLSWASVMDQASEKMEGGRYQATNESNTGREDKKSKGKVAMEREFRADFAADQPWHHYPPITSLSDGDRQSLALLVKKRADTFKPDFAQVYELLAKFPNLTPEEMKKAKCLDKAYAAGIRVNAPSGEKLRFTMTGNPEVVVGREDNAPLFPFDENSFERIEGEDLRMCAAVAMSLAFPPKLVAVKSPSGKWDVVY